MAGPGRWEDLSSEPSGSTLSPTGTTTNWRSTLPFFYGWVVVTTVFLTLAVGLGIYYSFPVFYVAMLEEFDWGRAPTAGVFSAALLVSGLGGIIAGPLADRFGPRLVIPAGAVILSMGLVATSRLTQLWEFYLFFGVVSALGFSFLGWVPCVAMLSRWFSSRLGLAVGIASAGIGLGMVVIVPLSQHLISSIGWRAAFLTLAVVAVVGIVPQSLFLQVSTPQALGLKPDGESGKAGSATPTAGRRGRELVVVDQQWASHPWSVGSALHTARFWLLVANICLAVITTGMLMVHQVAYLVDAGYDKMLAASVAGLVGLLSMPAKILWGTLSDRIGREVTFSLGTAATLLSILLILMAATSPSVWIVFLYAAVFAMGYAVLAPLAPTSAADIFAGPHFGAIYGFLHVGLGLGGAIGAWLAGYVFDATNSYLVAFGLAALSSCGGAVCLWFAAPRKVRRMVPRKSG